jgi:hypothetical protein
MTASESWSVSTALATGRSRVGAVPVMPLEVGDGGLNVHDGSKISITWAIIVDSTGDAGDDIESSIILMTR